MTRSLPTPLRQELGQHGEIIALNTHRTAPRQRDVSPGGPAYQPDGPLSTTQPAGTPTQDGRELDRDWAKMRFDIVRVMRCAATSVQGESLGFDRLSHDASMP